MSQVVALMMIRDGSGRNKIKGGAIIPIIIIFALYFLRDNMLFTERFTTIDTSRYTNSFLYNAFYAFWAVVALNQALRHEMNYKNSSWIWFTFILSSALFQATRIPLEFQSSTIFIKTFFLSLSIHALSFMYILLLLESRGKTEMGILDAKLKRRDWQYLNYNGPLWLLTFPLLALSLLLTWLIVGDASDLIHWVDTFNWWPAKQYSIDRLQSLAIVLSILFFVSRDAFIMLYLRFNSSKNITGAFILYLLLLYLVLPLLTLKANDIHPLFYPSLAQGSLIAVIAPAVQAALMFYLWKNSSGYRMITGVE
jgi:hypothetical protein